MIVEQQIQDKSFRASLVAKLESTGHDFKAAVIAAELADNGILPDIFFFRNRSTFKRPVSKDVEDIYWSERDEAETRLVFEMNREGIYDMLPEALIHEEPKQKRGGDATKLGNELRRQERDARNFFSPLENEFHYRSLKLDIIERELLKNNNAGRNREFFHYFFEDSSMLTDQQLLVLLHILPLSHKIRGDMDLIGLTLSRMLNYAVSISARWVKQRYTLDKASVMQLGAGSLGIDTILSETYNVSACHYDIRITGIAREDFGHFTGKGKHLNVINFILPYFLPADANYGVSLRCLSDAAQLTTSDDQINSYLGFNSYI